MASDRIQYLLTRAKTGQATSQELDELAAAIQLDEDGSLTVEVEAVFGAEDNASLSKERAERIVDGIIDTDKLSSIHTLPAKRNTLFTLRRIAVAAIVLVVAATAVIFYQRSSHVPGNAIAEKNAAEIAPGTNKATLTLANGTQIVLDTLAQGELSRQGNASISKQNNRELLYALAGSNGSVTGELLYNTVTIPRGGKYQLTLSDGTKVWLNAASSLRFPAAFAKSERTVELKGEGYFEVAKDAARPFTVKIADGDVRVLGTHFNISSYEDEDISTTTLLEGSIAVSRQNERFVLKPGEQAVLQQNVKAHVQSNVDVSEAIAWKEGYFQFKNADIASIMKQVSRWYDIDIAYKGNIKPLQFNGRIDRNIKLSGIINALKLGGINCAVEGNKLVVYP